MDASDTTQIDVSHHCICAAAHRQIHAGTLTLNKMVVQEDTPTFLDNLDQAKARSVLRSTKTTQI